MRIKRPDNKDALSIILESKRQMDFTLSLPVNEGSSFTIVRNIYECFRMLGDALLVSQGTEATDHLEPINALLKLNVDTPRPISTIDNLRRLRHNINYYGYHPSIAETNDAIDIANSCFWLLLDSIKKKIEEQD
ncbi:hypothetical protein HY636_05590 [Candidatus Woesearchaeota archaeon]|nr:hypothetical protein [Candidatus Woesearchaeota archaeon]